LSAQSRVAIRLGPDLVQLPRYRRRCRVYAPVMAAPPCSEFGHRAASCHEVSSCRTAETPLASGLGCSINPPGSTSAWPSNTRTCSTYTGARSRPGAFDQPFVGLPDHRFDAEMSRKLRSGGLLVFTCDSYFPSAWECLALLQAGVIRPDRAETLWWLEAGHAGRPGRNTWAC
jgi:hypothetical protein